MALQFIKSARRGKPVKWFVYAYKGGPRIMTHTGPRKPVLTAEASRKLAEALATLEQRDMTRTRAVLQDWRHSPEWEALEPSTRRVWSGHLDLIDTEWGDAPIGIWNDGRQTAKIAEWRAKRKDTPRSADIGVMVLSAWLKWAKLNGRGVIANPAADIPRLYRGADRSEIVWTEADMQRFAEVAMQEDRAHLIDGLWLAALTGLRSADLVSLTFEHVGEFSVAKTALKKSRGKRRRATIPMTPQLSTLLAELRTRARADGVDTVLVNSHGRPWTSGGFGGSFNRIRDLAGIVHVEHDGTERRKHLHDVRGTFCTLLLVEWELTDEQAAGIMGWSPARVADIRKHYVDGAQVVVAIGQKIAERARSRA